MSIGNVGTELESTLLGVAELAHTTGGSLTLLAEGSLTLVIDDSLTTLVQDVSCTVVDCDVLAIVLTFCWCDSTLSTTDSGGDSSVVQGGCLEKSSTRLFSSLMFSMIRSCTSSESMIVSSRSCGSWINSVIWVSIVVICLSFFPNCETAV